ncbi:MAG: hypothetical protein ABSE77_03395 [Acidimicrobiales bacterium]
MKRFLPLKKSLMTGAGVAIIALAVPAVASVAQADTPPADQIVLDGSCLSLSDVLSAAQQAIAAYVPGGPPAGVTINNTWVPAVFLLTNAGEFGGGLGLCVQTAPPATTTDGSTTPTDPSNTDPSNTDPNGTDPNGTDPNGTDPNGTDPNGTDPNNPPPCNWGDHGPDHGWGQPEGSQPNWGQDNWGQNNGGQPNWGQDNCDQNNGGQPNWGQDN